VRALGVSVFRSLASADGWGDRGKAPRPFAPANGRARPRLQTEPRGCCGEATPLGAAAECSGDGAQYLVETGVVGVDDFDTILQNSLGLRWATTGLFEGNVLGGGVPGGARHLYADERSSWAMNAEDMA
jgi:hypothetical protein